MLVAVRVGTAAARVHGMAGAWKRPGRRRRRVGFTAAVAGACSARPGAQQQGQPRRGRGRSAAGSRRREVAKRGRADGRLRQEPGGGAARVATGGIGAGSGGALRVGVGEGPNGTFRLQLRETRRERVVTSWAEGFVGPSLDTILKN